MARITVTVSLLAVLAGCSPTFGSGQPREVIYVPQGSTVPR